LEEQKIMTFPDPHEGEDSMEFTLAQIEYLRGEFERQRRWIQTLSSREKATLVELEDISSSFSYRVGRFLTWPVRRLLKIFRTKGRSKIHYFVEEEETDIDPAEHLFPSSLLITPELLPESGDRDQADILVEDILLAARAHAISVNAARDMVLDSSFGMDPAEIHQAIDRAISHMQRAHEYEPTLKNAFVGSLRALSNHDLGLAVEFGEKFQRELGDDRSARTLVQAHGKVGNFSRPLELLSRMKRDEWVSNQRTRFDTASRLLENGMRPFTIRYQRTWQPKAGSVIYHASQSMPHTTSGYAIRTHGLVNALCDSGLSVEVQLRHGYPLDRLDHSGGEVLSRESIDEVEYHFNPSSESSSLGMIDYRDVFSFNRIEEYESQAVRTLLARAEHSKPQLIHSASNFVVGIAGAEAARILGIPSVYEIRGFWHLTQASKRPGYEFSDHYTLSERMEIEAARRSSHVFTITNALRDILIDAGIDSEKVTVLPNAVDPERFNIRPRDEQLEADLGFKGKVVIGYIGSFVEYEGLNLLMEAVARLKTELGDVFRLLMVGDGSMMSELRRMCRFLQIEDVVVFTGRIPHNEVDAYYSLIDIVPLPRLGYRVCELVSPLKPFEAMGTGKVLLTSDVAALAEIVDDGVTGLIHRKDDADHLAERLAEAITDPELRERIGKNAREWVCETHSWAVISSRVNKVYDKLLEE